MIALRSFVGARENAAATTSRCRAASTSGSRASSSRCTCNARTARSRRSPTATAATMRSCCARRAAAGAPRPRRTAGRPGVVRVRRLLRPTSRRALPDLRLRPARRRRARPLRRAEHRGLGRRRALVLDPGRSRTRRASRTCAIGSAAPRRTTRSRSTAPTRRPTHARAPRCRARRQSSSAARPATGWTSSAVRSAPPSTRPSTGGA